MADRIKLVLAFAAVVLGVAAYYYLGDKALAFRVLAVIAGIGVGTGVALLTPPGQAALGFSRDAYTELRKVVWPTRKETIQVTLVVVVLVIIMALFLWFIDWALIAAMKAITGKG